MQPAGGLQLDSCLPHRRRCGHRRKTKQEYTGRAARHSPHIPLKEDKSVNHARDVCSRSHAPGHAGASISDLHTPVCHFSLPTEILADMCMGNTPSRVFLVTMVGRIATPAAVAGCQSAMTALHPCTLPCLEEAQAARTSAHGGATHRAAFVGRWEACRMEVSVEGIAEAAIVLTRRVEGEKGSRRCKTLAGVHRVRVCLKRAHCASPFPC